MEVENKLKIMCCSDYEHLNTIASMLGFLLFVGFIAIGTMYIATTENPYYNGAIYMTVLGIFFSLVVCACRDTTAPGFGRDPLIGLEPRPQYIYSVNKRETSRNEV